MQPYYKLIHFWSRKKLKKKNKEQNMKQKQIGPVQRLKVEKKISVHAMYLGSFSLCFFNRSSTTQITSSSTSTIIYIFDFIFCSLLCSPCLLLPRTFISVQRTVYAQVCKDCLFCWRLNIASAAQTSTQQYVLSFGPHVSAHVRHQSKSINSCQACMAHINLYITIIL